MRNPPCQSETTVWSVWNDRCATDELWHTQPGANLLEAWLGSYLGGRSDHCLGDHSGHMESGCPSSAGVGLLYRARSKHAVLLLTMLSSLGFSPSAKPGGSLKMTVTARYTALLLHPWPISPQGRLMNMDCWKAAICLLGLALHLSLDMRHKNACMCVCAHTYNLVNSCAKGLTSVRNSYFVITYWGI